MQKVEGSSPFIRLTKAPETGLFCCHDCFGTLRLASETASEVLADS